jgi:hypothetical protein
MSIAASPAGENWISDPDGNRWDVFTQDSRDPALSWKDNLPASVRWHAATIRLRGERKRLRR